MPHTDSLPIPCIIDANHANSGKKKYDEQPRIVQEILHSRKVNSNMAKFVKGVMVESYLVPGNQKIGTGNHVYGQSITDACIGIEQTEKLILDMAEYL